MFAEIEASVRAWFKWVNRSEWVIRRLGLPVQRQQESEPGLLLIQVDGFGRHQLERALQKGRLPFLKSLLDEGQHSLLTFYSGLPSTTPAVQAELFYGVKTAVPAFSYRDSKSNRIISLFHPQFAQHLESELARQGEGLLRGGSSWSNIYSGGASEEETHFCISRMGFSDIWRPKNLWSLLSVLILYPISVLRVLVLMFAEFLLGLGDFLFGVVRGQAPIMEMAVLLSRMCAGVALREVLTIGGRVDLARGLPVVHINFVGYDEMSHRRGPGSAFAHWSLRGIDRSIRDLFRAAHGSLRRDYHVWIFSDHGQESTRPFDQIFPGGLRGAVADTLNHPLELPARKLRPYRSLWRHRYHVEASDESIPFLLADMGPVAHLYLRDEPSYAEKELLSAALIERGVPGVLIRQAGGEVHWLDDSGSHVVKPGEVLPALRNYPKELVEEILLDMCGLANHPEAGHLVLLGWRGAQPPVTFAQENGSHAGPGLNETQGFLIVPPATLLPGIKILRPDDMRNAILTLLKRQPPPQTAELTAPFRDFHMASYNVHGCCGTDGRIAPRRIARILRQSGADIVAVQELDRHRVRSHAEDQVQVIAETLGFHHVFCPTVIRGEEQYGHAIFSRYPLTMIKAAPLPSSAKTWWPETRAALWCALQIGEQRIHLLTTHLGLGRAERRQQVAVLLGPDWIGSIPPNEPVLFCGDFNFRPGSFCHRQILGAGFQDAISPGVQTFSTFRPFIRLDYLFFSNGLKVENIHAIHNHLTRMASDHLPLVGHVQIRS